MLEGIFGQALWRPNDFVFMVGGDGNVIYYNIFYHTMYGRGVTLSSMNYPDPEFILMTDAQGMIAMTLNTIKGLIPSLPNMIIGIVHVIIMVGMWVQYLVLYRIIRKLSAPSWMAVLFALCIGTLAPQLIRIQYGHFGLAYPFIIPMTILWLWRDRHRAGSGLFTFGFIIATLFFGLNNPYLLVSVALLLMSYGFMQILQSGWRKKIPWSEMGLGCILLIILWAITHYNDPFVDRIQYQWGHFYYASTIEGILIGKYSLLNKIMASVGILYEGQPEARASISFTSIIIFVIGGAYAMRSITMRQEISWRRPMTALLGAGCLVFLYSSAWFGHNWWQGLVGNCGIITMIKASGRLSWILYYALSIGSISVLLTVIKRLPSRFGTMLVCGLGCIWIIEGYVYISRHARVSLFTNHYALSHSEGYMKAKRDSIDFALYQALYAIPGFQSWNDNIIVQGDWATELHAMAISSGCGIPLIQSRLSRAPVGRSLLNIQLSSDPLIYKHLADQLDHCKPILLLKMHDSPTLTIGEEDLIQRAHQIYSDDQLALWEIWPQQLNHAQIIEETLCNCDFDHWYYYNGMEEQPGVCTRLGTGGKLIDKQWEILDRITIPDSISGSYELSIWSKVNVIYAGMPTFESIINDAQGNQKSIRYHDARQGTNIQDGWIQTQIVVDISGGDQVILRGKGNRAMCVDELLLRPHNILVCAPCKSNIIAINNIRLE